MGEGEGEGEGEISMVAKLTLPSTSLNVGVKPVTVTVTDAVGATVTQTYNLEVLADTTAPVIELLRSTNIADIGETISFQVGVLGKFDPSLLENDSYRVRLSAFDRGGHISSIEDEINVAGELKLGAW
jgi:hypothetical protein